MTKTEEAIRRFCGRHADWWPSTTQVQEMLALAQPCPTCEALARTVMLDQTSHDTIPPAAQRQPLTDEEIMQTWEGVIKYAPGEVRLKDFARAIEVAHGITGEKT